jgi:hypothetical protein
VIPVTIRLRNSSVDQHITDRVASPMYRSVAPGGYAEASFSLHSPIDRTDPLLQPFTRVYVYDARSAEVVWEGRLQLPGRSADEQGSIWQLTASGPAAHTLDSTAPLIYIDRSLEGWVQDTLEAQFIPPSASAASSTNPTLDGEDVMLCQFADGSTVNSSPSSRASAGYYGFIGSPMEIGAFAYGWDSGTTNVNFAVESAVGVSPTYTNIIDNPTANVAGGSATKWVIDDFTAGKNILTVRIRRSAGGATTLAGDTVWAAFRDLRILGRRMSATGVLASGATGMGSSSIFVRASWVVQDLLGRLLPQFDGASATFATDVVDIDQLAYRDPVTPNQVLEDLMKLEADKYWAAWESNSAGKYRFEWATWEREVRYEATAADGFSAPAPSYELYDKVIVRWRDTKGRIKYTTRTQTITALTDNGITRTGFLDLSDEAGSEANAQRAGDNFLAEHAKPPAAGTLRVAQPILDIANSREVSPWLIRPGELIRVHGIEASVNSLAATERDGLTVFRIVSVQVDGDGIATLELDMFTQDEVRALSNLIKKRERKR